LVQEMRDQSFRFIRNIYQNLPLHDYDHDESRNLLYHMSKASADVADLYCQTNIAALKGYTRQKFVERARLVADSIARVHYVASWPTSTTTSTTATNCEDDQQLEYYDRDDEMTNDLFHTCRLFSHQLQQVQSIASIGCGPGSDLTGAVAATIVMTGLKNHDRNNVAQQIKNIIALDSSMDDCWDVIVKDVLDQFKADSNHVVMGNCDIRHDPKTGGGTGKNANDGSSGLDQVVSCGLNLLIVISYVLCETRGQWYGWMDDLVEQCAVGTLWLLTEPTAWQLHIFRTRYHHVLDHVWLDTSLYRPDLQELETRNGPAVLLCRRSQNKHEHETNNDNPAASLDA
jgi:hypothetical protein